MIDFMLGFLSSELPIKNKKKIDLLNMELVANE